MTLTSRIQKLTRALESLPHSPLPTKQKLKKEFYPFSNERGISLPYETLWHHPSALVYKGTIRVGILIGQSSFCSLLAGLHRHCDLIVFTDINPYLITHTRKLVSLLMLSTSRKDFENRYDREKEGPFDDFWPSQTKPNLAMRKKTLGQYHFLYSDENFELAQETAIKMRFAFSHVNLFHETDREAFFKCFNTRKCQITFFNATNLYEWDAPICLASIDAASEWKPKGTMEEIFTHLTKHKPIIMHSTRANSYETCPLTLEISFSYEEYLKKNEVAAKNFILTKFPSTFTPGFNKHYMDNIVLPSIQEEVSKNTKKYSLN